MHPVLARFLSLDAALAALRGAETDPDALQYTRVAEAAPTHRAALLAADGRTPAPKPAQAALLSLASLAALARIEEDLELGPGVKVARQALLSGGASTEQADLYLAALVLEEAFGWDEDAETFNATLFAEALATVPALVSLTAESLEALIEAFVASGGPDWRATHELAARTLVEAAWAEAAEPINREQLAVALEALDGSLASSERARGHESLGRFLVQLEQAGVLGPLRREGLTATLREHGVPAASPRRQ